MEKKEIRKKVFQVRKSSDPQELEKKSQLINQKIIELPAFQNADTIFVYMDCKGEVSVRPMLEAAWAMGKKTAAPKVTGPGTMKYYYITSYDDLAPGYYDIPEPVTEIEATEEDAFLIVPGVGFDKNRHRCGYGQGFYDRFLAAHPGMTSVAIAFDFQVFDQIPSDQYDVAPELLVTESTMYGEIIPKKEPERQYYFMEKCREKIAELSKELGRPLTASPITFGCQMNARDSEKLAGILEKIGYQLVEGEDADFVIYNTCTVRENANLRVYGRLGVLGGIKKKHPHMLIALCGCMMQEKEVVEKLQKSYRFVDLIFGTHNIYKFAELIYQRLTSGKMVIDVWKDTTRIVEDLPVERKYPFKSGVNIMFGCNNFCSYCIVPYVRGRERSREPKDIIREIERLVADGVVEVMLLGQNVNSYGKNLEQPVTFAQLLQEIEKIEGLERIRFMTSHPKDLSDELIEVMAHSKKICKHMHLPLQSGSSRLLKIMNRHYDKEQYLTLVKKLKDAIPDISLTTDIIVGFPGETEEDFEETLDVVRKVRYDSAFTFIYSKRTGTPAAKMDNQVPEEVVKPRFDRLLKEVQEISREESARLTGQTLPVLVEEINDHDASLVTGRLSNNLLVHFPGTADLIGKIVDVYLAECKGFYYMGEMKK
ncbi:(Dimethylallyl)adenosine tRNA methylthiotransferase MiaB [uncultured Clostridium sp.]|nr:(Dimethylallyl)adenosine tRNA methylthiotransferase MiaB [uncultured Clostridium sp.]